MYLDALKLADDRKTWSSNPAERAVLSMTGPDLPPSARGYCVYFWYNMYGRDVETLEMHAKVSAKPPRLLHLILV